MIGSVGLCLKRPRRTVAGVVVADVAVDVADDVVVEVFVAQVVVVVAAVIGGLTGRWSTVNVNCGLMCCCDW